MQFDNHFYRPSSILDAKVRCTAICCSLQLSWASSWWMLDDCVIAGMPAPTNTCLAVHWPVWHGHSSICNNRRVWGVSPWNGLTNCWWTTRRHFWPTSQIATRAELLAPQFSRLLDLLLPTWMFDLCKFCILILDFFVLAAQDFTPHRTAQHAVHEVYTRCCCAWLRPKGHSD